jgi:hypothetical protein
MNEKLVNSVLCIAVPHATVHNTAWAQCCVEFVTVLLSPLGGDMCSEAGDVYVMARRNKSSLDITSFFWQEKYRYSYITSMNIMFSRKF